jgi:hypothetical protein
LDGDEWQPDSVAVLPQKKKQIYIGLHVNTFKRQNNIYDKDKWTWIALLLLIGIPGPRRPLERCRREDNIKMDLTEIGCELESFGSGYGLVVGSCVMKLPSKL